MNHRSSLRGRVRLAVLLALVLGACSSADSSPSLPTVPPTTGSVPAETAPPATAGAPTTAATATTPATRSRQEATRALCRGIDAAAVAVADGRLAAGGLGLSGAVNTYGAAADPAVAEPARRMLSSALGGDFEASADAAREAQAACARHGATVRLPGGVQCVTTPCP